MLHPHHKLAAALCVALCVVAAPIATADILFDTGVRMSGDQPAGIYHPVSSAPDGSGYETYQPFTVQPGGWDLSTIGFFGRVAEDAGPGANGIMFVTVHAWSGTLGTLGAPIDAAIIEFANTDEPQSEPIWFAGDFSGTHLDAGSYVVRARGLDSFSDVLWHHGGSGPTAIGLRLSDGEILPRGASAAVVINGLAVPAPGSIVLLVGAGVCVGRKRRVV